MATLLGGLRLGAGFGLAASAVEIWLQLIPFAMRRMGPGPVFLLETAFLEIALGALLGVLLSPLVRLRGGRGLHVLALAAVWAGLVKWVELDSPVFARFQLVPPAAAALLTTLGFSVADRRPLLPVGVGVVLLAGAVVAPDVFLTLTTPERAVRTALPPARPDAPDVVVIVLDTVRARNLSAYGYERATSPAFDALASEGTLFLDATSPSTWSLPSHASLFTGRYPTGHGAHAESQVLGGTFPTLAEVLAANGYETFCFTANAWISDGLGLTRGFGWQDTSWRAGEIGQSFTFVRRLLAPLGLEAEDKGGGAVASNFADWALDRPPGAPPAFVFLNFIEAHFPYHQLPGEYLSRFTAVPRAELRRLSLELLAAQFGGPVSDPDGARGPVLDMYDAGVLYTDHLLDRVVSALRERGSLDRTILVVLGDHGELLGERGDFFGHGPSLYEPMIRVPLLVRYPPEVPASRRVATPVSTVGVFGTVAELARVEPPPTLQVASLVPIIRGGPTAGPILSERMSRDAMPGGRAHQADAMMRDDLRFRAYRVGRWKLVETSGDAVWLFDLATDPGEERNLAGERPEQLTRLLGQLATERARLGLPALEAVLSAGPEPELDPETRERLRALGYAN